MIAAKARRVSEDGSAYASETFLRGRVRTAPGSSGASTGPTRPTRAVSAPGRPIQNSSPRGPVTSWASHLPSEAPVTRSTSSDSSQL